MLCFSAASLAAQSPNLPAAAPPVAATELTGIRLAQHHFYSGQYDQAIALAGTLLESGSDPLAAYELKTSAAHFKIKRLLGDEKNKGKAFKACAPCAGLQAEFLKDVAAGKALAEARLKTAPDDLLAKYYFGKLDLNYIWLQLATLGKRTGWGEYWSARRTMDAVIKSEPGNVRARVARAWIDYIVDTRVPFGLQWTLGGGDKKRALKTMREAAATDADFFVRTEAEFALWEMLVQEKQVDQALDIARRLAVQFPNNQELQRFIQKGQRAEGKGQK